jgi:hypothetical protein
MLSFKRFKLHPIYVFRGAAAAAAASPLFFSIDPIHHDFVRLIRREKHSPLSTNFHQTFQLEIR